MPYRFEDSPRLMSAVQVDVEGLGKVLADRLS